jgi:hypothetical protein
VRGIRHAVFPGDCTLAIKDRRRGRFFFFLIDSLQATNLVWRKVIQGRIRLFFEQTALLEFFVIFLNSFLILLEVTLIDTGVRSFA